MRWSQLIALGIVAAWAAPVAAQDDGDVAQKVDAIRQRVEQAADAAKTAIAEEQRVREEASQQLTELGEGAIPALVKVVEAADEGKPSDPDFVARCREALERLGWVSPAVKQRMAELIDALKADEFDSGDTFAVIEIGAHAARELSRALDDAAFKDKPAARVRMLHLLGGLGGAGRLEVIAELLKRLGSPTEAERVAAAQGLAAAAEIPTDGLTGEPDQKRIAALDEAVRAAGGVARLCGALAHGASAPVRSAAAEALGALKRKDAVAALVGALSDQDGDVREAAGAALGSITELEHGTDAAAWSRWWGGAKGGYPEQVPVPADAPSGS